MKSEKGITLESLMIYVFVTILAIGILSKVSTTFYTNMQYVDSEGIFAVEYQKFNSTFLADITKPEIRTLEVDANRKYLLLYNKDTQEQIKYTFTSTGIYRNEVQVCGRSRVEMKQEQSENDKKLISVLIEYTGKGSNNLDNLSKVITLEYSLPV